MSVLVKGMYMPYGCANCPFCSSPIYDSKGYAVYSCLVDVEGIRGRDNTQEVIAMYDGAGESFPDWCPLVEVSTPHGMLIDEDELYREVAKAHAYEHLSVKRIIAMIRKSPTVIEAEE